MNSWKVATISLGIIVVLLLGVYSIQYLGLGRSGGTNFQGTLTAPSGNQPFGGSSVGAFSAQVSGHEVSVQATVNQAPASGKVFEGWLVDPASGYKLSIGQLDGTRLQFSQTMVNPSIYKLLVITVEPLDKTNPNPSGVIFGGAQLPQGFGQ
jgi:hypothetical protein